MENLIVREFKNVNVRILLENDEFWFSLRDVCLSLGLKPSPKIVLGLDPDEVKMVDDLNNNPVYFVSESGLYSLTFTSEEKKAKEFKRWVTHEILPSIRKIGSYSTQIKPLSQLELLQAQLDVLKEHDSKLENHERKIVAIEAKVKGMKEDWFAIKGYANLINVNIGLREAQRLGKQATDLCCQKQITPNLVRDERFGYVNSYPEIILKTVFKDYI
jgi:prophage antirepressor-like protein